MTSAYDFGHGGTVRDMFRNVATSATTFTEASSVETFLKSQPYADVCAQADCGNWWNVNAIHDWPRLLATPFTKDINMSVTAQAYLQLARGIPVSLVV